MDEEVIERVVICPECEKPADVVKYPGRIDGECFACGWFESWPIEEPD